MKGQTHWLHSFQQKQFKCQTLCTQKGKWPSKWNKSFPLTSPMYLMVAKSLSPTRIRAPTSRSLTSTRLFMMLQQCEQRPTMARWTDVQLFCSLQIFCLLEWLSRPQLLIRFEFQCLPTSVLRKSARKQFVMSFELWHRIFVVMSPRLFDRSKILRNSSRKTVYAENFFRIENTFTFQNTRCGNNFGAKFSQCANKQCLQTSNTFSAKRCGFDVIFGVSICLLDALHIELRFLCSARKWWNPSNRLTRYDGV